MAHRLVAALSLALPLAAGAACKIETVELPVKMVGSRAVATVGINGTPVPLTVDSGAFFSFLTDAAAAQLKLTTKRLDGVRVYGITGGVDTRVTTVDTLRLFKGEIAKAQFIVGGNEPGAGTMGLLGRNVLSLADTEYDLAHGVIRIVYPSDDCAKASMAYWAGATPVNEVELLDDRRTRVPAIRAVVKLNGAKVVALLDTGATTVVTTGGAERAGVAEKDMAPGGFAYGAGQGSAKAWTAGFERFELGGESISNNRLRVADFRIDDAQMLLGIDYFLAHRIYVSRQQSKLFVTYNGGTVFALNRGNEPLPGADPATDALPASADAAASAPAADAADQFARRGAASAARGNYASALADLDRATALEPSSAAHLAQRGALHEAMRQPSLAMEDFDKALALDPTLPDARMRRALLRLGSRNREGAKADLEALARSLAPQATLRLPMARLYETLDEPARALAQLDQWLPAHPNDVDRHRALNSRCYARARLGIELAKAVDDCDDALDSDPKNPAYLDSRAWVRLKLGQYEKAVADFDRSIELRPIAFALYGRSLAQSRLGKQGETDLAAAKKLEPEIEARAVRAGFGPESLPRR